MKGQTVSGGRRRPLVPLACPARLGHPPLGYTDGKRVYVGGPEPSATVTAAVVLNCAAPNCAGHVAWHPGRSFRALAEGEDG